MHDGKGTVTSQNSEEGVGNDRLQFKANNERAVQTLKPSSAQKNALREFLVIDIYFFYKNLLVNLLTGFPHLPITADELLHILQ